MVTGNIRFLNEAMVRGKLPELKNTFSERVDFYEIADDPGKQKTKSHLFIGSKLIDKIIKCRSAVYFLFLIVLVFSLVPPIQAAPSLNGIQIFPSDYVWNVPVDNMPVSPTVQP